MLATGGSDAVVNLWYDSTASEKEEAFRKEVSCCTLTFIGYIYILELEMLFLYFVCWSTILGCFNSCAKHVEHTC